ncbi:hypothetical protein B0A49_04232 [Cryomyces minteri]|uniref:Deacetylase sirtuin-type domain-containing protein n=1 Tax=Cryomyces minteri TaxID=331657 RepID=A0A4U0XAU0_9PEZI|nr:hypothetical protein B0A49_04232 [Cryomyces minteri]
MDSDNESDVSSRFSSLGPTPSPPPELSYPSPRSSHDSSKGNTPDPDGTEMESSAVEDGAPPAKKRRMMTPKPRTTEHLDLRSGEILPGQETQLTQLLKVLHKKRKIVVVAGAGISVSAGIPDFRSSTGLFHSLRAQHNIRSSGKHLFDASVYKDDSSTATFHDMVRSLSEQIKGAQPTAFHHLLATLAHEGRLLRLYSQNVDGIDTSLPPLATEVPLGRKAPWPRTIQLHGGLDKMVCSKCHKLSDFESELFCGPIPPSCTACEEVDDLRTNFEGKRSHGIGRMRPRMVLYNEHNPDDEAIGAVTKSDLRTRPDAIIVVGTTLKVPGVKRIVREMCGVVRGRRGGVSIWINNDPAPLGKEFEDCWDLVVRGKCDEVARHAAMRQWNEDDSYTEVTDEEMHKARQNEVYVDPSDTWHTSETWKEDIRYRTPMPSPAKPRVEPLITPRHTPGPRVWHEVTGSFTKKEDLLTTPSKKQAKRSNAGSKRTFAESLAPDTGKKQAAKPRAKAAVKSKAGAAKKTVAPQVKYVKINLAFKVTKPASTAAKGAAEKNLSKSPNRKPKPASQEGANKATSPAKRKQPMGPVSPQAARNNTSTPHKLLPVSFPGLKKEGLHTDFRAVRPENSPPADMLKLMN